MAKVISILNHKGGVGKTATTANLGAALQSKGLNVLLIDLDGQANLTDSLGLSVNLENTIYEAMRGKIKTLPIYENKDGLQIVPACLDLSVAETELLSEPGREIILASLLKPLRNNYDYILIDCPPSLSLLTLNAMTASDSLIIPVQAEYLAMRGMAKLTNVIDTVKERLNQDLKIEGILITLYDNRKNLNQSISEMVKEHFKEAVFNTVIRNNVAIGEATTQGRDVIHYAPKSAGAEDYISLCNEILKN